MSITSLNQLSDFYQQPLLPLVRAEDPERIVSQKTIHQWNVNECVVYLIKEHNSLKYKTIDGNKKEIYCNDIDLPEEEDLEQEISYLKTCKVMVEENGAARFYNTYHTWRIPSREFDKAEEAIHTPENDFIKSFSNYQSWEYDPTTELILNRGTEDLVWNVFRNFSKKDTSLQEVTVPSSRCHPGTVALVNKIKKEAFNNPQHILCLIRDFKVRVINSELFQKELAVEKNNLAIEASSDRLDQESFLIKNEKIVYSVASGAMYLSKKVIVATANSVSKFCGNGILGTMAGAYLGFLTGTVIAGVSTGIVLRSAQTVTSRFFPYSLPDFLHKKQKSLEERASLVSVERPLFIEIEPISEPIVIDPRVRVSKFTWAVTVITTEGVSRSHAAIVIEGINDGFFNREACLSTSTEIDVGEKFIYLAEFNPPVEAHLLSLSQLEYEKRTEIWMRTSDKVQEIIRDIGKEVLKETPRQFNIRGKNALLPNITYTKKKWVAFFELPGDNCYTFTKDHAKKLDIDPGSSSADFIAAIARLYTKDPASYKAFPVQQTI
ncbi:hypothetical protein RHABOEDO_000205 [Candidatus Rhabdochlamydia oedothoracis]|uniref:Uncharacterized protein n=1 Tax=Candidatus Rhabdochlamydia oedothoracis TaxID=2720720 RepID=A0ABX8UYR3_9BACT|nr:MULTISPECIES: hypothetical protein [Rhabdochlamydia]KAG6559957.1 hypothetical protein RHOW815_000038 [Candidatus Rhabdochlamydia sp. W815]QYF48105.1 hypothetical protein RHABOEDO_000205 [Candidatus Rhabdochlamydia oedothoracis]